MTDAANKGTETRNLERARKVQMAMLRAAPKLPGIDCAPLYRAGVQLGGDFYDFIDIDTEHLGIVVAGVAGEGPAAAMLMASAKKVLQLAARGCTSPAKTILEVNDSIRADLPVDLFVAVFYGVLHVPSRRLTWVTAGMQPPALSRGGKVVNRWPAAIGPALGVTPSAELAAKIGEEKLQLQAGDTLLAYTHGLARAADSMRGGPGEGAMLSELATASSAAAAADAIRTLLDRDGRAPADDQTLVVLRVDSVDDAQGAASQARRAQVVLPAYSSSLLGRDKDLELVSAKLARAAGSALTLTGPAGVGKTRLAVAVGSGLREQCSGGVYYVDLQTAQSVADVCHRVAKVLQLDAMDASLGHRVGTALASADGPVLLLLDNCDLAAVAVGRCASEWRVVAPQARIIMTSRAPLDYAGEVTYEVKPLAPGRTTRRVRISLEDAQRQPAVQLFADAARREDRSFELTAKNCELIFEIVSRLDFIPHAIELAAARIGLLSPRQILDRLDERFTLLRAEGTDAPEGRSTLYGALAWSWELLAEDDRRRALQLSHFRDGFQAEVAAEMLGEATESGRLDDLLQPLRRQTLSYADRLPTLGGVRRHYMYESARLFALQKLRENGTYEASRARYEKTLLTYTRKWWSKLRVDGSVEGRMRLMLELVGLEDLALKGSSPESRAWAIVMLVPYLHEMGDHDRARQLMRNCRDGLLPGTEEWHWTQLVDIELKLELDPEAAERETNEIKLEGIGRFHVLLARATALSRLGRLSESVKALQAAAVVPGIGAAYGGRLKVQLGQLYEQAGRYEEGLGMYQAALRVALTSKDTALEAEALLALGQSLRNRADYTEAAKYLRESLRLAQSMGDRVIEARALAQLAVVQNVLGERQTAEASILRALRVAREGGSTRTEAAVLNLAGNVYFEQGRVAEALQACQEARDAARNCGARRTEIAAESNIAALNIELGQEAGAMEALEKAHRMARELKETGLAWTILSNIGELHAIRWKSGGEEREYKAAVDALRRATEERRKIGMAPLFTAEQMLAELLFDAGESVAAREFAQKALQSAIGRGDRLATDVAARAQKILDGLQVPAPPAAAPSPVPLGRSKGKRPKGKRPRSPAPLAKGPAPAAKAPGSATKGPGPLKPRPRKRR